WNAIFSVIRAYEARVSLGEWIEKAQPKFGPGIRERFEQTKTTTSESVAQATAQRALVRQHLDRLLDGGSVICLPTAPVRQPLRTSGEAEGAAYRSRLLLLSITATIGGLPQISLPLADNGGIPVGLSLIAARGSDRQLLRLAEAIEKG